MSVGDARRRVPRPLPGATVLQIVPSLSDCPLGRGAVDVAWALLRTGARAVVAGGEGPLTDELRGFGGEWMPFGVGSASPFRLARSRRDLVALVGREGIDIVHAAGVGATLSAADVPEGTMARLVNTYAGRVGRHDDASYTRALARSDRVIAASGYVADLLIDRDHLPPECVAIVPRRIDTARFDPSAVSVERIAALRHDWQIHRGERIVLAPGRVEPANGHVILVEAVRALITGGMRHVVFVLTSGEPQDPAHIQGILHAVAAHGVGAWFRLTGPCPDMPAAYAAADFVVVPAIEPPGIGHVAAEALAMGRPVVATAVGALPEFVLAPPLVPDARRAGWLVEPGDAMALARVIAAVAALDLPALRILGIRARKLATMLFAPERVAAATLAIYAALLAGPN